MQLIERLFQVQSQISKMGMMHCVHTLQICFIELCTVIVMLLLLKMDQMLDMEIRFVLWAVQDSLLVFIRM